MLSFPKRGCEISIPRTQAIYAFDGFQQQELQKHFNLMWDILFSTSSQRLNRNQTCTKIFMYLSAQLSTNHSKCEFKLKIWLAIHRHIYVSAPFDVLTRM
jgi:hypothetical protein